MRIESNIPIPPRKAGYSKYPLGDMRVGDSFETDEPQWRVAAAVCNYGKRHGKKFSTRTLSSTAVGVWRTK